ncbi:isoleucine--tRNA ligase [Candidatus Pacearchaeota archaeon]|nr:isoleucine--tRNA ligase [Candidatus Pacearchaeota archaeon]
MYNFEETEAQILKFWEEKKIFDKLMNKNKGGKKWSFIDGPITANNPMGVHHAWGRTYKDLFQRFKAMQGFEQRFQNGFDCQGLWVEREEEKELGLKNKKDIEKFGILNFVNACRKRVERFSKIQQKQSIKLGQWMDWNNNYYTMSDNNNLHNWFLLKKYFENGMLYKGKDAVPWCPRCGTASSKHDIITEGYKEVVHNAMFMQFPIFGKKNEYFLIFTTTPWTVPANVAIAVNENIIYAKAKQKDKYFWIAESRLNELKGKYEIVDKKKGKELEGIKYEMPYKDFSIQNKSPHKVVLWELASGEEGTGIVHIAPGCGAEDFEFGKRLKLPAISPLDDSGIYQEGFGDFAKKDYREVNKDVVRDLEKRGFIYKTESYKHRYPHCWRCGEELVFRLVDEWYIKGDEIRNKLIKENEKIKWFPEYGGVRQSEWFKNMGDWLISRKRYWGLPLPIWECSCGRIEVIGSLEELKEKAVDKNKVKNLKEVHRPWIDEIKIKCKKCGKEVSRIPDVGDAWLDAGIVPFSTLDYLNDKKHWKQWFPADFICENMPGQYRGWFNALMWASVTLSGNTPFKSILGHETLKDEKGDEMHKSKGNVIWFDDAVEKIGADTMRFLYCLQDPGQELRFGFNAVKEPFKSINILHNLGILVEQQGEKAKLQIEDKWILSRFNSLVKNATNELENLHPHLAARALQDFWLNDLSRGYVQIVRDRIAENDKNVMYVLLEMYVNLLKLLAPITPFITEFIWQKLREKKIVREESVHLCDWPKSDERLIDKILEGNFNLARALIEKGLAERDKLKIGLKWPLAKAVVFYYKKFDKELGYIIARQLNVKSIEYKKSGEQDWKVEFDTKITPELEIEGIARELSREIQAERRNAGLNKSDRINLAISSDNEIMKRLEKIKDFIMKRTGASQISFEKKHLRISKKFKVKDREYSISFVNI